MKHKCRVIRYMLTASWMVSCEEYECPLRKGFEVWPTWEQALVAALYHRQLHDETQYE